MIVSKSGDYLAELRRHRGLSQDKLAKAADLSLSTVSKIEIGNKMMSVGTYHKLMDVLKAGSDERKIMLGYIVDDRHWRWLNKR